MQPRDNIDIENRLAEAMLTEVLTNKDLRAALKKTAEKLQNVVLAPLKKALSEFKELSDWPEHLRKSMEFLAKYHSKEDKQRGAIHPALTSQEVLASKDHLKAILDEMENRITSLDSPLKSIDDVYLILKTLTEMGYCYDKKFPNKIKSKNYSYTYTMIYPTPIEEMSRIDRKELGQEAMLARTTGIRTEKDDLISQKGEDGIFPSAGKSVFGLVKLAKRVELIIAEFKRAQTNLEQIKNLHESSDKSSDGFKEVDAKYEQAKKCFEVCKQKMIDLNIPLDCKNDKKRESTIERLSKMSVTSEPLPLIASVSGTMARTLSSLVDVGAFLNEDDQFDIDRAQKVCNCLMASLLYGGHHSFLELAEPYNRLLDYFAILKLDSLESKIVAKKSENDERYIDIHDIPERVLPYYVIGDYLSFFHKSIVHSVVKTSKLSLPKVQALPLSRK